MKVMWSGVLSPRLSGHFLKAMRVDIHYSQAVKLQYQKNPTCSIYIKLSFTLIMKPFIKNYEHIHKGV